MVERELQRQYRMGFDWGEALRSSGFSSHIRFYSIKMISTAFRFTRSTPMGKKSVQQFLEVTATVGLVQCPISPGNSPFKLSMRHALLTSNIKSCIHTVDLDNLSTTSRKKSAYDIIFS